MANGIVKKETTVDVKEMDKIFLEQFSLCERLERKIRVLLKFLAIPGSLSGYDYLIKAIETVYDNPTAMSKVTQILYPNIAKEFNTTPCRVERAIRHAIENSYCKGYGSINLFIFGI